MSTVAVIHRKAYRYRLRTLSGARERTLRRWEGCCRKVWNLALDRQQKNRAAGEKYTGFAGMCRWLTEWRSSEEYGFLRKPPVHAVQNVLRSLDTAFQRFFRRKGGYPRFKRYGTPAAHTSQTCAVCGHVHAENRQGERFLCLFCGHTDHADVNAAKNILAAGLAVLAGQSGHAGMEGTVPSGRPMKRQPTEERRCARTHQYARQDPPHSCGGASQSTNTVGRLDT